jgi:hypothetical protein
MAELDMKLFTKSNSHRRRHGNGSESLDTVSCISTRKLRRQNKYKFIIIYLQVVNMQHASTAKRLYCEINTHEDMSLIIGQISLRISRTGTTSKPPSSKMQAFTAQCRQVKHSRLHYSNKCNSKCNAVWINSTTCVNRLSRNSSYRLFLRSHPLGGADQSKRNIINTDRGGVSMRINHDALQQKYSQYNLRLIKHINNYTKLKINLTSANTL